MRLTVLGRSPARPNPGEACAGYLVEDGGARLLLDIGPGIVAQLLLRHHPDELSGVIISHMHADHMLDLVTLRYVYPWRRLDPSERLEIILPPGSADQLTPDPLPLAIGADDDVPDRCVQAAVVEQAADADQAATGVTRREPGRAAAGGLDPPGVARRPLDPRVGGVHLVGLQVCIGLEPDVIRATHARCSIGT